VVDCNTIDAYLYEIGTQYLNRDAEKAKSRQLFDNLDFVFMDGEANLLPWQKQARKVRGRQFLILMRMCRRTNKCLFAASSGLHMLVFLCASRFNIRRVINGKGRGSQLSEMRRLLTAQLEHLSQDEVFFDNATGDIYAYDFASKEFYPVSNTGFHYHKAAQENRSLQSSILKPKRYQPQQFDELYISQPGKLNETLCQISKPYMQHWLVKDIGLLPFLVPQLNAWDVHPVNMREKSSYFTILGESDRSPQIVTLDNTAAVQFSIDRHYSMTVKVLENYIVHIVKTFEDTGTRVDKPLASVKYTILPSRPALNCNPDSVPQPLVETDTAPFAKSKMSTMSRPMTGSTVRPRTSSTRPETASTVKLSTFVQHTSSETSLPRAAQASASNLARHSGYAFSKRFNERLTVDNNATSSDPISLATDRNLMHSVSESVVRPSTTHTISRLQATKHDESIKERTSSPDVYVKDRKFSTLLRNVRITFSPIPGEKPGDRQDSYLNQDSSTDTPARMTRGLVRSLLHPGYDTKTMPKARAMFDTSAEGRRTPIKVQVKLKPYNSEVKAVSSSSFVKTRTTLYPNLGFNVANDGSLYKTPEERRLSQEHEHRRKWTSQVDFRKVFKTAKSAEVPKIHSGKYNPPSDHQFRTADKRRWVDGDFKTPSY
jgi:hypothetical protein